MRGSIWRLCGDRSRKSESRERRDSGLEFGHAAFPKRSFYSSNCRRVFPAAVSGSTGGSPCEPMGRVARGVRAMIRALVLCFGAAPLPSRPATDRHLGVAMAARNHERLRPPFQFLIHGELWRLGPWPLRFVRPARAVGQRVYGERRRS